MAQIAYQAPHIGELVDPAGNRTHLNFGGVEHSPEVEEFFEVGSGYIKVLLGRDSLISHTICLLEKLGECGTLCPKGSDTSDLKKICFCPQQCAGVSTHQNACGSNWTCWTQSNQGTYGGHPRAEHSDTHGDTGRVDLITINLKRQGNILWYAQHLLVWECAMSDMLIRKECRCVLLDRFV